MFPETLEPVRGKTRAAFQIVELSFNAYSPGLITASLLYYPLPVFVTFVGIGEGRLSIRSSVLAYLLGGLLILGVIWGGVYHFTL